jgi:aminopeptidase-like protein
MAPESGTLPRNNLGESMHALARRLYPLCRSITGNGVRETLRILGTDLPLKIEEVPSGTKVLDWEVPDEWNIRAAYIARENGRRIVDFADHNLHILQYSVSIDRLVPMGELRRHLHSLAEAPDLIPYRTAYYAKTWGFCLRHRALESMLDAAYRVHIDSTLAPGHLSYGELFVPGTSEDEVLFSIHCCHPSLANDNLSGMVIARALAEKLLQDKPRLSYRFLFIPGTIGSITWLARNRDRVARVKHGLVLSCLGDAGPMTYKRSRRDDAAIDRAVAHVLQHKGADNKTVPFIPYGYDERQYCSPGFDLPVGCLMRSPNGTFPEYHTSADNLDFIQPDTLADSLDALTKVVEVLEHDGRYRNTSPYGEPQLGRRGLYRPIGGQQDAAAYDQMVLLWALNLSDGEHSLLDIAKRAERPFAMVRAAATDLQRVGLLEPVRP